MTAPRSSRSQWHRFRMDAARWVVPEGIAPLDRMTPLTIAKLTFRTVPLRAMAWFRFGCAVKERGLPFVPGWVQRRLLVRYGLELMVGADIGGGLYIAHPVGCVLMVERMGENVTVISAVTFGMRKEIIWPTVEDGVFVGVGARVIGGITLGAGAKVGACALVMDDVAPGETVVGVPARPVRR